MPHGRSALRSSRVASRDIFSAQKGRWGGLVKGVFDRPSSYMASGSCSAFARSSFMSASSLVLELLLPGRGKLQHRCNHRRRDLPATVKTAVASTLKAHPGPHGAAPDGRRPGPPRRADETSATPSPRRLQAPPPSPWCSSTRRRKPGWVATGTVVASPSTRAPTGRVAAGVAGALHISPDKTANSAFTVRLAVAFSGTYDCNQHVSSKAQHKHTVLISFTGITEEEAVAALSSLHRRENASVPFTGVSAIAMLPDIPISEGKSEGTCASRLASPGTRPSSSPSSWTGSPPQTIKACASP